MDSDTAAVLGRLQQLCAAIMALLAYGDRAPQHVRYWADKEVGAAQEIRDRLRPEKMVGLGASWWNKKG
jgi:hypothetical protein